MSPGSASPALTRLITASPGRSGGVSTPVKSCGPQTLTAALAPSTMPVTTGPSADLMPSSLNLFLELRGFLPVAGHLRGLLLRFEHEPAVPRCTRRPCGRLNPRLPGPATQPPTPGPVLGRARRAWFWTRRLASRSRRGLRRTCRSSCRSWSFGCRCSGWSRC